MDNAIILQRPDWTDFLEPIKGNNYQRYQTGDKARVTKSDENTIIVEWEKWPAEKFRLQKNGAYIYTVNEPYIFPIKHPHWSDILQVNPKTLKGCRQNEHHECATVTLTENDTILIQWDNPNYASEEFYRGVLDLWIFKED